MKKQILIIAVFLAYFCVSAGNISNVLPENGLKIFVHANIKIPDGTIVENASMIVEDGIIKEIGKDLAIPDGASVIEMNGKYLYPALVNAYSALGITEISAIWQTMDVGEKENFNPNIKAQLAFNNDSEHIVVTRANGIAYNVTVPSGGIISGTTALMMFKGWNWEEMLVKAPVSLFINWPGGGSSRRNYGGDANTGSQSRIDQLYEFFDQAEAYKKAYDAKAFLEHDLRFEAMIPVLNKEVPVWITADQTSDIQAVLAFADHYNLKIALVGGLESVNFATLLKEKDIPVIVPNVFALPNRTNPDFDTYYALPSKLFNAGIKFCIAVSGNMEVRNLPFHAGKTAAYGLPIEEALKAITQYPADVIGVGNQIGSLQTGKAASFIVTDGNPLEVTTKIEQMFINGTEVSLDNKHKDLYEKYKSRYTK